MICRYDVECPGCAGVIRLRISVALENRQGFYFVCPHCSASQTGALLTDQDQGAVLGLELDGAPAGLATASGNVPVINVFTDLPVDPTATSMEDPTGSPFLMHSSMLGEGLKAYMGARAHFMTLVEADWKNVVRWWGYYLREDWANFDRHATTYFSDDWPANPSPLAREDAVHRALEFFFVPLFPRAQYARWKKRVRDAPDGFEPVAEFARSWCSKADVAAAQASLFELLDHYTVMRHAILPGLVLEFYENAELVPGPSWRLMRDDYRELRDLYIALFERSYKFLPVVMGFDNANKRGRPDAFPDGTAQSISSLASKKAWEKETALKLDQSWGTEAVGLLDRTLRNAIGHADAYHDKVTGKIKYKTSSIPYLDFVQVVGVSIQVPLLCLDTIKMMKLFAMT